MGKKNINGTFVPAEAPSAVCDLPTDSFTWEGPNSERQEGISRPSISYWKDAMRRLKMNKVAMLCVFVLCFIMLFAVLVPLISPYTISEQHLTTGNSHPNAGMFFVGEDGHMHIFGTDDLGRDLFTRIWHGARTSLFIAYSAVFVNLIVGVIYGCFAGYIGGNVDTVMMRVIEVISGIPYLIIVILMSMILPTGVMNLVLAYAVIGWVGMARLTRGQILSLKNQEFVMAAKALGAPAGRIIFRHLLPNILSVVIINITLAIPSAIFTEAFLSLIGMGVPIPEASWGTLAQNGILLFQMYPIQLILPAIFISVTMLSFNLLGDGMRDAFDPRLRR